MSNGESSGVKESKGEYRGVQGSDEQRSQEVSRGIKSNILIYSDIF